MSACADGSEPDVYAGGDPVMGSIAVGHDYCDTTEAQSEIDAAEAAKGAALSDSETADILAKHPSADESLANGPAQARAAGRYIKHLPLALLGGIPWFVYAILALALLILLAPYITVVGKLIPERAK